MSFVAITTLIFLLSFFIGFLFQTNNQNKTYSVADIGFLPIYGLVVQVIGCFWFSRLGLKLDTSFAYCLTFVIVSTTLFLNFRRRGRISRDANLLAKFGFLVTSAISIPALISKGDNVNWLAFGNDDSTNYMLGAQKFQEGGFYFHQNIASLASGKDWASFLTPFYLVEHHRPGSELILAFYSSLLKVPVNAVYMPMLTAINAMTLLAIASLVYERIHRLPFVALFLIAINPLLQFGLFAQLSGQIGGIALSLLLLRTYNRSFLSMNPRLILESCLILSASLIWYPELTAIILLSFFMFSLYRLRYEKESAKKLVRNLILSFFLLAFFMQTYLFESINFILHQITNRAIDPQYVNEKLFPFYLQPRGLSVYFGFVPMGSQGNFFVETFIFMTSIILMVGFLVKYIKTRRELELADFILLIFLLISVIAFVNNQGFALFKIAMYAQGIMLYVLLSIYFVDRAKKNFAKKLAIAIICLCQMNVAATYAGNASGWSSKAKNGFSLSQRNQLVSEIREKLRVGDVDQTKVVLTSNPVMAKTAMIQGKHFSLVFPNRVFDKINHPEMITRTSPLWNTRSYLQFPGLEPIFTTVFPNLENLRAVTYVNIKDPSDPFNRSVNKYDWRVESLSHPRNMISFIDSSLGHHYYLPEKEPISFYQSEINPLEPSKRMNAVGEFMLIAVEGLQRNSIFRFDLTSSFLPNKEKLLPKIVVYGSDISRSNLETSGSAVVLIPAPKPLKAFGRDYFLIQFQGPKFSFPKAEVPINMLWKKQIRMDSRTFVTFVNNIELITKTENNLHGVPINLSSRDLSISNIPIIEKSGMYEDGWLAKNGKLSLRATDLMRIGNLLEIRSFDIRPNRVKIEVNGKNTVFLDLTDGKAQKLNLTDLLKEEAHHEKMFEITWAFRESGKPGKQELRKVGGVLTLSQQISMREKIDD